MYHELSCFVLIHGKYKTQISQLLNNLCEHVKNTSRDNEFAMKEAHVFGIQQASHVTYEEVRDIQTTNL